MLTLFSPMGATVCSHISLQSCLPLRNATQPENSQRNPTALRLLGDNQVHPPMHAHTVECLKIRRHGGLDGADPLRSCRMKGPDTHTHVNTMRIVARHKAPCVLNMAVNAVTVIPPGQTFFV